MQSISVECIRRVQGEHTYSQVLKGRKGGIVYTTHRDNSQYHNDNRTFRDNTVICVMYDPISTGD